ncbi:Gfo/Idh/MocA family oxidoreductase [Nonomuraea sp. FMUSA5-5]|uniref:Gfo/Idh/MocA family oxidoreductase n=1 Tax=Nonomuraea composti TaxID=2720023 RepID=A0ABX1BEB0_9ACTN|nr:Gfo/Idh/MocA family oxidoreductase [Nonomuraea sp. FMUSA5-5]NJP96114.1 Gfo/Idh/MocA family oxidoreductase [Nonomuraea sp. FMUSA5-5]
MPASSPPIRVAVIGAGGIAKACHLPALAAAGDEVEIVAVCDVDPARTREVADAFGVPARHTDPGEMLAAHRPDLVVVATPPVAHREAVTASLDAGAWVWCEKPPTLSLAEYDEITAHERDGGPYASYVFQHRFGSAAQRLRRHIGDGELGAPLVAVCNTLWYRGHDYFEVPWRGKWETEGGGPTMGHGIHQMDLMLSLLGDWQEVHAVAATLGRRVETEDVSFAIVRFASGAVASVVNSVLSPRETSYLRFDFADATVEVEHLYGYDNGNWRWTPAPHVTDQDRIAGWAPEENTPSSHRAQLAALLAAMRAGERPQAGGADGRRVMELITGMYQSALTGRPVSRAELVPANPFYHALNGGDPRAAAARLRPSKESTHA